MRRINTTSGEDIRWQQWFQNFQKSLHLLGGTLAIENPDIYQKAGLIQFFETTIELSWKLMKDYLEAEDFIDVKSPRAVIKKAFETELIKKGHIWMELLQYRNLTAHTYDEEKADLINKQIREKYHLVILELYNHFNRLLDA